MRPISQNERFFFFLFSSIHVVVSGKKTQNVPKKVMQKITRLLR